MTIVGYRGIYRNTKDMNERIDELLGNWTMESEAISECLADITLDHSERRAKTDAELTPRDLIDIGIYGEVQDVIDRHIDELKDAIYSGYEETPLTLDEPEKEHRMNTEEMADWLAENVKPLIQKGITKRKTIADELECPAPTILWRIRSVFGKTMDWNKYVEKVKYKGY